MKYTKSQLRRKELVAKRRAKRLNKFWRRTDISKETFQQEYQCEFISTEIINKCGDCKDFDNGCTTSSIERKYGNSNTPACSEFISKGNCNE